MARSISYNFEFKDGAPWNYVLEFDDQNVYVSKADDAPKPWTHLDFHKCGHCPLNSTTSPQCPVAKNLNKIVEDSKGTLSITKAKVTVVTPERTYSKECATQDGLRSLFGMVMASSGCPRLDWLRPLARFHLPFADVDETLFRVLSLQLVEDYLLGKSSEKNAAATHLEKRYRDVERVNHTFIERIRSYCKADADKNAIAALDVYAQLFPFHLEDNFRALRELFK